MPQRYYSPRNTPKHGKRVSNKVSIGFGSLRQDRVLIELSIHISLAKEIEIALGHKSDSQWCASSFWDVIYTVSAPSPVRANLDSIITSSVTMQQNRDRVSP